MDQDQNESPLIDPSVIEIKSEVSAEVKDEVSAAAPQPRVVPARRRIADKGGFFWGTGRRKSSVARVRLKPGEGKLVINKREADKYFTQPQDRRSIVAPLKALDITESFDIFANVKGGGTTGQAGAIMLGIARALINYDESMMKQLRDGGYLTRDGRMVERKKPGQRGARRKFQFSKR